MYFLLAADAVTTSTEVSIGDALLLAVIAIAVIMLMLSALMAIIYAMPPVINWLDKTIADFRKKKAEATAPAAAVVEAEVAPVVAPKALAKGSCGEICLYNVEPRTAAMIMAIVANEMDTPINELRFK